MNGEWSLEALYTGYDDPVYLADLEKAEIIGEKINLFSQSLSERSEKENLLGILSLLEQDEEVYEKLFSFCSLKQEADTTDAKSASYLGQLMQMNSKTAKAKAAFVLYISKITQLEVLIEQEPMFKEYADYLKQAQLNARYLLSEEVEEALAKYSMSGAHAWADLQAFLTSSVKAEYEGKKLTLSALRNLAYDSQALVRKKAYEAELTAYDQIKDAAAFALNSIKMQTWSECELRGFASPLEKTLYESRMQKQTLDALIEAMREYMPKLHRYLRAKGKALGHENGLPWYDLFAPMGKSDKKFTVEQTKEKLQYIFGKFNSRMVDMISRAFDEKWIDFYPREGKVGGAFCAGISSIRQFRILTNFDGSFSSLTTLAHELGHGYHDFIVQDNRPLNRSYSMPVAETASTFNENIVLEEALTEADSDEEKLALLENELMEVTQVICDIYSRFIFEYEVCERRKDEFMFADQLCKMMLDAQKEAYGDGLEKETLHPYMWVCKSHYYDADLAFYNFPYAFGGLFARGLYAKYCKEGKNFLPQYDEMLRRTPIASVEEVARTCGIDLTKKDFWLNSLQSYTPAIEEFERLAGGYKKDAR